MRMRFATKMLTHEINIHREEISKQALEFTDRNKEKKARDALILEAIRVKKQNKTLKELQVPYDEDFWENSCSRPRGMQENLFGVALSLAVN
uniref:Ulp1 protease family, C-terminal catalytic domain-containing protein n=1 Tax=Tanacetum cinerariifolium TaxID=118510 RepID=A0A699K8C5_TANCI|nr:ulp1 protease family, C-terminal catalytic domain-containing protein [Tanacetum cinerariifolium]